MSHYEPEICGAVFRYLRLLRALRQVGPWYVSYSLLNAKNTKLNPVSNYRNVFDQQHVFGGDHVAPDPVVIPADFTGDEQALMTLLRPALDQFWAEYRNLYGARSYDESGRYRHVGQW